MKKLSLAIVYVLGLACCLFFRFLQISKMTNPKTGFLLAGYENTNYMFYGLAAAFVLFLLILGVLGNGVHKKNNGSKTIGVFSIIMGLFAFAIVAQLALDFKMEAGIILYVLFAFLFGIYMICLGVCELLGKKISAVASVIPVLFAGVRLSVVFLAYYGLAKTVDITLEIIMLIVSLLFWHYFSKFQADVKPNKTSRWLVGFALSASLLCFATVIPSYYSIITFSAETARELSQTSYFDLATGVYILIFLLCSSQKQKDIADEGTANQVSE